MKKNVCLFLLLINIVALPNLVQADKMPCSIILEPIDKSLKNTKGTAMVYKVQLGSPPSFPRTNISIIGVHLPSPSSYGQYDGYEGYAAIPNEISWRFRMYPTPEVESPTWAGRFDLITADMKNVKVQIRLSNSKTKKLGPPLLQGSINICQ